MFVTYDAHGTVYGKGPPRREEITLQTPSAIMPPPSRVLAVEVSGEELAWVKENTVNLPYIRNSNWEHWTGDNAIVAYRAVRDKLLAQFGRI